ncbi:MAG: BtpA/SgcQ family protein [Polyangiaceae bacterium]
MTAPPATTATKFGGLVGVLHLPPLPGSPRAMLGMARICEDAAREAFLLADLGFDLVMIENFGDAPFFPGRVPSVTVSAMTACVCAVRDRVPKLPLGVNVLRNDADSALAIAAVVDAACIRVNVHTAARVTDQGLIQGDAANTLRTRRALGASSIAIWADVDVKHAAALAPRPIGDEAKDIFYRGMVEALLVTGQGTGGAVDRADLAAVRGAVPKAPLFVASGTRAEELSALAAHCDGVIVGSAIREGGIAGAPLDPVRCRAFAEAFRSAFR